MELLEQRRAAFKFRDATLFVRTAATAGDRLALDRIDADAEAALRAGATPALVLAAMGERIVELFLDGWEGVTVGGKPAPYSFAALKGGFPAECAKDLFSGLGRFINENVDVLKSK